MNILMKEYLEVLQSSPRIAAFEDEISHTTLYIKSFSMPLERWNDVRKEFTDLNELKNIKKNRKLSLLEELEAQNRFNCTYHRVLKEKDDTSDLEIDLIFGVDGATKVKGEIGKIELYAITPSEVKTKSKQKNEKVILFCVIHTRLEVGSNLEHLLLWNNILSKSLSSYEYLTAFKDYMITVKCENRYYITRLEDENDERKNVAREELPNILDRICDDLLFFKYQFLFSNMVPNHYLDDSRWFPYCHVAIDYRDDDTKSDDTDNEYKYQKESIFYSDNKLNYYFNNLRRLRISTLNSDVYYPSENNSKEFTVQLWKSTIYSFSLLGGISFALSKGAKDRQLIVNLKHMKTWTEKYYLHTLIIQLYYKYFIKGFSNQINNVEEKSVKIFELNKKWTDFITYQWIEQASDDIQTDSIWNGWKKVFNIDNELRSIQEKLSHIINYSSLRENDLLNKILMNFTIFTIGLTAVSALKDGSEFTSSTFGSGLLVCMIVVSIVYMTLKMYRFFRKK